MNHQQSLFDMPAESESIRDPRKIARRTDPDTSHQAAQSIAAELSKSQTLFYETLKAWGGIPRTANEVAARAIPIDRSPIQPLFRKRETLRKRAKELVDLGLIRASDSRPCMVNGNPATTYEVIK